MNERLERLELQQKHFDELIETALNTLGELRKDVEALKISNSVQAKINEQIVATMSDMEKQSMSILAVVEDAMKTLVDRMPDDGK